MASREYVVKVVDDGEMCDEATWAMVLTKAGQFVFVVTEAAAGDPHVLADAWAAARRLEGLRA